DKVVPTVPANQRVQTFYGIVDPNTLVLASDTLSGRVASLVQQQILVEQDFTFTNPGNDPTSTADDTTYTVPVRVSTANPQLTTSRGWYLDLLSGTPGVPPPSGFKGEMQVTDSVLRNGRVVFTTLIPDPDPCNAGGTSWLMEMDALSGARLTQTPFDNN